LPSLLPIRAFGTVVTLSIINREALFRPLRSVGSTSIRPPATDRRFRLHLGLFRHHVVNCSTRATGCLSYISLKIQRDSNDACLNGEPRTETLRGVIQQHGHSVEVMLGMYAARLEGATELDIQAIKQAMEKGPAARAAFLDARAAISAVNAAKNRVEQFVIRPLKSPEFSSSLAVGKCPSDSSLRNDSKIRCRCSQSSAKSSL
jgi:hypothetical protein